MLSKQQFRLVLVLIGLIATIMLLSCKSRQVALNKHSLTSQSTTKVTDKSVDSSSVTLTDKIVTTNTKTDNSQTYETDSLEVKADSIWVDKAGNVKAKGNANVKKKLKSQTSVNTKEVDSQIKDLVETIEHKREANIVSVKEEKKVEKEKVKTTVSKPTIYAILIPVIIIALLAFIVMKWKWLKAVL